MSSFKVLQFNMQFGQRWDDAYPDYAPIDLDLTITEIRRQDADIVLLQEVERACADGVQRDPPVNYTQLRGALPEYQGFFAYPKPDPRELPFGIGLAMLSKTRLSDPMRRALPSPPIEFEFRGKKTTPTDRLLIGATTTLNGRALRIFNTHLLAFFMLNASSEQYAEQRKTVVECLRAASGPVLLGGDFNVSKHHSLTRQFADAGFKTVQMELPTWRRRPFVLDHIFYNDKLHLVSHAVKPTPASDHHMLIAEFEFSQ